LELDRGFFEREEQKIADSSVVGGGQPPEFKDFQTEEERQMQLEQAMQHHAQAQAQAQAQGQVQDMQQFGMPHLFSPEMMGTEMFHTPDSELYSDAMFPPMVPFYLLHFSFLSFSLSLSFSFSFILL
jgi:hypothetical protein